MTKLWSDDWAVAYHAPSIARELAEGTEQIEIVSGLIQYGYTPIEAASIVQTTRLGLTAAMAVGDGDLEDDDAIGEMGIYGLDAHLAEMALALGRDILEKADTVENLERRQGYQKICDRLRVDVAEAERQARAARSVLADVEAQLPRQMIIDKVRGLDVVPGLDVSEFVETAIIAREAAARVRLGANLDAVLAAIEKEGLPAYVQVAVLQLLDNEPLNGKNHDNAAAD